MRRDVYRANMVAMPEVYDFTKPFTYPLGWVDLRSPKLVRKLRVKTPIPKAHDGWRTTAYLVTHTHTTLVARMVAIRRFGLNLADD